MKKILIIIIILLILSILILYFYPKIRPSKIETNPCDVAENCTCNDYSCDCDYYNEKLNQYKKIECPIYKID